MAEKVPVTIEMLRPRAGDRSPETNSQIVSLMKDFFGMGGMRYYLGMRRGDVFSEEKVEKESEKVDKYALDSIKREFNLPEGFDRLTYVSGQKQAIGVPSYYTHLLPDLAHYLDLKNEVRLVSDRPSALLKLLSKPSESIDPTLAYEVHRHTILSYLSGQINTRTLNGRLLSVLSEVYQRMSDKLFEGPQGWGERFRSNSIHDDETNTVVGFADNGDRVEATSHVKNIVFNVRKIADAGYVYVSPRKKDDRVALIKAVAKAQENGGIININNDVLDGIGIMMVLMEDQVIPEELAERVVALVRSDPKNKVIEVANEDLTGTDHGQSPEYKHVCRRIKLEGVSIPFELIVLDRKSYLNSILEVGIRDPKTGLYTGRAHTLFELRRAAKVARRFFPEEIYPVDLNYSFVKQSRREAREHRDSYKVAA